MGFKEMAAADRAAFIDIDFFGSQHTVEGKKVTVVVDDDSLRQRQGSQELTIAESTLLFFAKTEDLPKGLSTGKTLNFDGKECLVDDIAQNMGIAAVTLRQNRIS